MYVVFFVSRNKDNKDIPNFKERKVSFVVNDNYEYYKLCASFTILLIKD